MGFRNKLSHIKTGKKLFGYFSDNARYMEDQQSYYCAGIYSDDTGKLFQKLKVEWIKDKKNDVKRMLKK